MASVDEILQTLKTRSFGRRLYLFERLESTNSTADELARDGAPEGTVVVAEEQTLGRGRLGRRWLSEAKTGLYFSLILRPAIPPREAPVLSLAAAVALHQAMESLCGLKPDIKWPNDVLIRNRKCAGILLEMSSESDELKHLVLGIGVNVGHDRFPLELEGLATSLFLESGHLFAKESVMQSILESLEPLYDRFLSQGSCAILDSWIKRSSFAQGRRVVVELNGIRRSGVTWGVTGEGALQVKLETGGTEEFLSGDVVNWE